MAIGGYLTKKDKLKRQNEKTQIANNSVKRYACTIRNT